MFGRITEILEGWRNHLVPPEELRDIIQQVHEERMNICNKCPFQSENAKNDGYTTIRVDVHCTKCGCPLVSKTKSLSSKCPIGKWSNLVTNEEKYLIEQEIKKKEDEKDS